MSVTQIKPKSHQMISEDLFVDAINRVNWPLKFRLDCQALSMSPYDYVKMRMWSPATKAMTQEEAVTVLPSQREPEELTQEEMIDEVERLGANPKILQTLDIKITGLVKSIRAQWGNRDFTDKARSFAESALFQMRVRAKHLGIE